MSGARLMPQLPVITVVTPWLTLHCHQRIAEQRAVVVGVGVDEARRQRQAVGLDFAAALESRQVADRDDAIVLHREIAAHARPAAAVDQQRVADDEIGLGCAGMWNPRMARACYLRAGDLGCGHHVAPFHDVGA